VLQALRRGLGVAESSGLLAETSIESKELAGPTGEWDAHEQAAFQEAMQALSLAKAEQLAPVGR
jgi:hypothetical protein